MEKNKVEATIVPICINGCVAFERGKMEINELSEKFNELTESEEFLKAFDDFVTKINELFGKVVGLDKYIILLIPTIFPIKDKEYANIVKEFTEKVLNA